MENLNELGVANLKPAETISIEGGVASPVKIAIDTFNALNDLLVKIFF
jgi:hypothetical protein